MITVLPWGPRRTPLCVALVDDYDVVVVGLAHLLDPYARRVVVAELDANDPVWTTSTSSSTTRSPSRRPITTTSTYWWATHTLATSLCTRGTSTPTLIDTALAKGAHGYLSKTLPASELVDAIEAIAAGDVVVSEPTTRSRPAPASTGPDAAEGLTDREAE